MRIYLLPALTAPLLLIQEAAAFSSPAAISRRRATTITNTPLAISAASDTELKFLEDNINADYILPPEEVNAVVKLGKEPKTKLINPFGFWSLLVSLIVSPVWFLALKAAELSYKINPELDPNREFFDFLGKCWSKAWLTMTFSKPTFSGEVDLIKKRPHNQPCLFVANHASWLDIPVLSSETSQVFKFMSKKELGSLPCIGDQLRGVSLLAIHFNNIEFGR